MGACRPQAGASPTAAISCLPLAAADPVTPCEGAPARSAPRGGPPCARAPPCSWRAAPPAGPQCSALLHCGEGRAREARTEEQAAQHAGTCPHRPAASSANNVLRRVPASVHPPRTFSRIFSAFCLWMASMSTRLFLYTLPFTCRAGARRRQAQTVSGRVSRQQGEGKQYAAGCFQFSTRAAPQPAQAGNAATVMPSPSHAQLTSCPAGFCAGPEQQQFCPNATGC